MKKTTATNHQNRLLVSRLPEDTLRRFKAKCAANGVTMTTVIKQCITAYTSHPIFTALIEQGQPLSKKYTR
jgi:predicted DNA binding CopG/RHH family protein